MSKRYNGYDNYPTWRVMAEILGNIEFSEPVTSAKLKQIVEDDVFVYRCDNKADSYAHAFLSDVNYYQLKRLINEELEKNKTDYQKRREHENN